MLLRTSTYSDTRPVIGVPMSIEQRSHLDGIHVLVVDDNEDARKVLEAYLIYVGAKVTTARSGGEALAIVAQVQAHVIVSDVSMPGMTGIEFIREVRKLPGQAERPTPAIAFTAFADRQSRSEALERLQRLPREA